MQHLKQVFLTLITENHAHVGTYYLKTGNLEKSYVLIIIVEKVRFSRVSCIKIWFHLNQNVTN